MNINHVTTNNPKRASFRYRIAIPTKSLPSACVVEINNYPKSGAVNVYHKHDLRHAPMILRTGGVFDVTDDHFAHPKLGDHYRYMCDHADLITCSSPALANRILKDTGKNALYVPDPFELPESVPKWSSKINRFCWFGHHINFDTMQGVVLDGPLKVVTGGSTANIKKIAKDVTKFSIEITPWSFGNLVEVLQNSDFVVIPQHSTQKAQAKSANRAVNAIRQGKLVIASPTPAINNLKDYLLIVDRIDDFIASAIWARRNIEHMEKMITSAQEYISIEYNPKRISNIWRNIFHEAESRMRQKVY